jgi:RES domain-containing protein
MNLAACGSLPLIPETGTWYRAVQPGYLHTALSTSHTTRFPSRYNAGSAASPPYETLYLAENPMVAQFEVGALFGTPLKPGGIVPNPAHSSVVLNFGVRLSAIVDLTDVTGVQAVLDTNVQELTGDWEGYDLRGPHTKVQLPVGLAPTQELGAALHSTTCEGFRTVSSKLPYHEALVLFPQNLQPGSFVRYTYTDSLGVLQTFQIP